MRIRYAPVGGDRIAGFAREAAPARRGPAATARTAARRGR